MEYNELTDRLKNLEMTKKKFAEITGQGVTTITNWKGDGKKIPAWVDTWLDNYEKAQAYELIKNKILELEARN
ncbi:XRE family transcriptional regulator (plasmid) [Sulfurimonas aquatica]|uniref:XRE family transcriptional regulator n=1 Tax=Sulfurimonas aquatica TaxID=2672570 RepID=A0A975GE61_9BACT|nr:XRE family transcriptional regulator [Sulfurimonas aquatica]QSZ43149.1 XRE family transcriptional regulator [Sulfurimonas aquatica]